MPSTTRSNNDQHSDAPVDYASELLRLEKILNETEVKHREQLYWLRLELDTTRKEKEVVEDRIAELYRDVQDIQQNDARRTSTGAFPSSQRPLMATDNETYIIELETQLDKYEHMIRLMSNQISLVRNASQSVTKSLKDELSDLMDEKCKVEATLMNQLAQINKEKHDLMLRLCEQEQSHVLSLSSTAIVDSNTKSVDETHHDEEVEKLNEEVRRLKRENKRLSEEVASQRKQLHDREQTWNETASSLNKKVEQLENELIIVRTASDVAKRVEALQHDREETLATLERVAMLWDRADESIQALESTMMEVRPHEGIVTDEQERLLSTLETASLLHGQVKVSLMLIELKLRNTLASLKQDQNDGSTQTEQDLPLSDRIAQVQHEAMTAIKQVEDIVESQVEELTEQSVAETKQVRLILQSKVDELHCMQERQELLEKEINLLHNKEDSIGDGRSSLTQEHKALFVSRDVMERLQNEVLQIVERVKEKNETIGRLTAVVDEHKVREKTLMEELKRHMKEQAARQLREGKQEPEARQQEQGETARTSESGTTGSEYESSGVVSSSVYDDEEVVEEESVDEVEEEEIYE